MPEPNPQPATTRRWSIRSLCLLVLAWLILQIGGLFSPGLLDDVDSIYIEIAREMLQRHDYVTPYINGIRFFDKPPLMYWMAAASMHVFGIHDWAPRLPLALCVLALLLATYALGIRLFSSISPAQTPDRGGFYAALALATCIGPYLYTRFYIPDILLALWMTLAVHLFLIALDRIGPAPSNNRVPHLPTLGRGLSPASRSSLLPCLAFAAVMALNVLTKGLIGLVFPVAFVFLYLAITRQLPLLLKLHPIASTVVFIAIAAPWHILAALRNPAISMPPGLGLPARAGWAWFYLYNEHIARFLGKRIPHDYGLTPVWLFWLYLAIWIMPWTTFLPSAIANHLRVLKEGATPRVPRLRDSFIVATAGTSGRDPISSPSHEAERVQHDPLRIAHILKHETGQETEHEAALALVLWATVVLFFFSISNRQEYYSLPAIPALALMAAGLLAQADARSRAAAKSALDWHLFFLLPVSSMIAAVCFWFAMTARQPPPHTDLSTLLAANPELYNLSLGHLFDLTAAAMGLFRGPLVAVALGMVALGPGSYLLRRQSRTYAANLMAAAAMTATLLAAHEGLTRFYPILGSKQLALAINEARQTHPGFAIQSDDLILLDGELTSGSTLIFYTGQQIHLLNGRVNGLWYGSFWPDAPPVFETESTIRQLWASPRHIFLFTYNPAARTRDLAPFAAVHVLAAAGGKTVLTNR